MSRSTTQKSSPAEYPGNRKADSAILTKSTSGPIPSSVEFKYYNDVLPGAADRILRMAEEQQIAILEMNKMQIQDNIKTTEMMHLANMAQINASYKHNISKVISSVLVCLTTICAGGFAIYKGYPGSGATIITATLIGVISAYMTERLTSQNKPHPKE